MAAVLLCVIPLVAVCGTEASAQDLRNINNFAIVIEPLNQEHASHCGITKEALDTSLRFILQQSRIKVVQGLKDNWLYLNLTLVHMPEFRGCVYSIALDANTTAVLLVNRQKTSVPIWHYGYTGIAHADEAAKVISEKVETGAKSLVADWTKDNSN